MPINTNSFTDWRAIKNSRPTTEDRGTSVNSNNTDNTDKESIFPKERKVFSNYVDLRKKIANFALSELQWWLNIPNRRRIVETDSAGIVRITSYWNNISGASAHSVPQTAWSGVFVSTCIKLATNSLKIKPMPLRLTEAHFRYAKAAYNHRIQHPSFPGYYWAYTPLERIVQVGDIIVKERKDPVTHVYHGITYRSLATETGGFTHGDIVTELQSSSARALVVGGNVSSSVTQTNYILTNDGRIDTTQSHNAADHVFTILSIPNPQELKEQSYPPPAVPEQDKLNSGYV